MGNQNPSRSNFSEFSLDEALFGVAELRDDGSRHRNILKLEVVN